MSPVVDRAIGWFRGALVLLVLGALLLQIVLPSLATEMSAGYSEVAHLALPYAVAGIAALGAVEVGLFALWRLAGMVRSDRVFSEAAFRWVDVLRVALTAAAVLTAAPMVHLLFVVGVGGPGIVLGLAATVALGGGAVLLVTVMRGILRTAIADRTELAAVI